MTQLLSFVIPAYNEEDNLQPLFQEIKNNIPKGTNFEVIFINDGSTDTTQQVLESLYTANPKTIKVINFAKNFGKSNALNAGFSYAQGDIIFTLDADLQDDPAEIPKFIQAINAGSDLVSGWKYKRLDSFIKNHTSKIYNAVVNKIFGLSLHDKNCGYKAYTKTLAKELHIYGEMHRYIPVLAHAMGFSVSEIPVHHRKRHSGKTKFGKSRFLNGFLDLLTILYLTTYRHRPLHLFGYTGSLSFLLGFLFSLYLTFEKFYFGYSIGTRPLLLLGVMLMIMGVQLVGLGLLGEQITSQNKSQKNYRIRSTHGL